MQGKHHQAGDRDTGKGKMTWQEEPTTRGIGRSRAAVLLLGAAALAALYVEGNFNYLLFHSLAELASVAVAWGVFFVFWNTRRFLKSGYFLFLGVALLFVAALDLLHTLAYQGMGVFPDAGANLPTQLWIAARYVQAGSLLLAPMFLGRRVNPVIVLAGYAAVVSALLLSIFVWTVFPDCLLPGVGLTPFKKTSEYLICLMLLASIGLLFWQRRQFDRLVFTRLILALAATIVSELAFTLYATPTGPGNLVGHLLKIVAVYLFYRAMIEVSLRQPYTLLFRELAESQQALQAANGRIQAAMADLEEAKTAAEKANLAKSQFLAHVSHELRTPMSAILGMSELALAENLDPVARDHVQTVKESADTLLGLLNEILDFSRIESGGLQLEQAPFSLRSVFDRTLKALGVRAQQARLALTSQIDPQVPDRLVGDSLRLRQVLTNLVGNAIKFTPAGEVGIRVSLRTQSAQQVELEFAVRDTGVGISEEEQARLFQPFSQADVSTARQFGGSGLGLAISARLVALMGGRIWVESRPRQGSTFFFTARLRAEAQDEPYPKDLASPAAHPTGPDGQPAPAELPPPSRPLRVLLAEDTPANQKLVARILGKRGHEVEVAHNGSRALEMLQADSFHLVLMDVQMPVMDGFQATAEIRALADPAKARVPIVAMTAHAMKGDQQRCLDAGMNDYVAKPISSRDLIEKVERLAGEAHA